MTRNPINIQMNIARCGAMRKRDMDGQKRMVIHSG